MVTKHGSKHGYLGHLQNIHAKIYVKIRELTEIFSNALYIILGDDGRLLSSKVFLIYIYYYKY